MKDFEGIKLLFELLLTKKRGIATHTPTIIRMVMTMTIGRHCLLQAERGNLKKQEPSKRCTFTVFTSQLSITLTLTKFQESDSYQLEYRIYDS